MHFQVLFAIINVLISSATFLLKIMGSGTLQNRWLQCTKEVRESAICSLAYQVWASDHQFTYILGINWRHGFVLGGVWSLYSALHITLHQWRAARPGQPSPHSGPDSAEHCLTTGNCGQRTETSLAVIVMTTLSQPALSGLRVSELQWSSLWRHEWLTLFRSLPRLSPQ